MTRPRWVQEHQRLYRERTAPPKTAPERQQRVPRSVQEAANEAKAALRDHEE